MKNYLETNENEVFECILTYAVSDRKTLFFRCSHGVRHLLHQNGDKVNIDFKQCRIFEHLHVVFCNRCCSVGHTNKNCSSEDLNCANCNEKHDIDNCKDKHLTVCHACAISNDLEIKSAANTHKFFSGNCPSLLAEKKKLSNKIYSPVQM